MILYGFWRSTATWRVRLALGEKGLAYQPLQNTAVQLHVAALGLDERAWARHWVARGLEALEGLARTTAGRFAVGDTLSVADVCLVPQLHFARRFGVAPEDHPTLARVERECAARPAFVAAHAEAQPDAER